MLDEMTPDDNPGRDDPTKEIYPDGGSLNFGKNSSVIDDIDKDKSQFRGVYWTILQTNTKNYPVLWRWAHYRVALAYGEDVGLGVPAPARKVF